MDITETLVGLYHFLGDRTPGNIPVVEPKPRRVNRWRMGDLALVARMKFDGEIRASVERAVTLLGGLDGVISRGDRVMVKPNFNSPDPPPASTDLSFLEAAIEVLKETGAKVTIGESAGGVWRPTRNVFRKLGLYDFAQRLGVGLIDFDGRPDDWVHVKVDGDYFQSITMPRSAYEADKLVYITCMKTHFLAGISGALKTTMGFIHPAERRAIHLRRRPQKIAEISLCWQPDLIIMDGRKAFVTGGPTSGRIAEPGIILASGDLVAIDAEAAKTLLTHGAESLPVNPWKLPMIAAAVKHGLGVSEGEYTVLK